MKYFSALLSIATFGLGSLILVWYAMPASDFNTISGRPIYLIIGVVWLGIGAGYAWLSVFQHRNNL